MYGVCDRSGYYLEVWIGGNLPCNAEDNLRVGLLVIEARFRSY